MGKKLELIFSKVPFWKQIIIWLISIFFTTKIFGLFEKSNNINWFIIQLLIGFIIGLALITYISKKSS